MIITVEKIAVRLIVIIAAAFLIASGVILLPNASTSFLLASVENAHKNKIANDVVFIPPAVEADEPPMNIRR